MKWSNYTVSTETTHTKRWTILTGGKSSTFYHHLLIVISPCLCDTSDWFTTDMYKSQSIFGKCHRVFSIIFNNSICFMSVGLFAETFNKIFIKTNRNGIIVLLFKSISVIRDYAFQLLFYFTYFTQLIRIWFEKFSVLEWFYFSFKNVPFHKTLFDFFT